jgi:hypothetical protein
MGDKKTKRVKLDQVPNLEIPIEEIVLVEHEEKQQSSSWTPEEFLPRYIVVRGGLRVSDKDYPKPDEPRAIAERDFWQRVINQWETFPDGTKVEIVQFDKKKHRIW